MSVLVPDVDLRPDHWDIVRSALRRHVPDRKVLAFGSRAAWTAKDYSDLDLAIMGEEPLSLHAASALSEAFGDSDLPFRVDIVDWARIDEGFRATILQHGVAVQTPARPSETAGAASPSSPTLGISAARSDWRESRWGDEISLEYGKARRGHDNSTGPFRVFGSNGPIGWTDTPLVRGPGVVLGRKGAYRGVAYSPDPFFVIDTAYYVASKSTHNMRWLFYAIKHYKLGEIDDGSPIPSTTRAAVYPCKLTVPPLSEQRAIAHILGTLDDKIEMNRRMNETLETMARALFKSWFVDFDPVRAKMECRDTGLPQDIADLFPDRMVDSELGEIPEGWDVKALGDCMLLTMGQSPPGSTYNEDGDGLPFFQGRSDFGFRYPTNRRFCSAPTRIARSDDTLVSVRAPVGDINVAWERCCIGRGVAALRHRSGSASYTYHSAWAMQRALREYQHTGTVFGAINKGQFEALRMTEPDPEIVDMFDSFSRPIDTLVRSNIAESRTFAALRDTLLPKLISGEIRLDEAASIIAEVP